VLKVFGFTILLLVMVAVLSSVWLSRPAVDGHLDDAVFARMTLAPPEKALTLASSLAGEVLLVTGVEANGIAAINVNTATGRTFHNAVDVYRNLGINELRALYNTANPSVYAWVDLGMPVPPLSLNIAAGTNYRAHAKEVGHEGEPFLFPKLSTPTPWDNAVAPGARLDYEVELCAVTLTEHRPESPAALGYVLCGDFTDRWLLVRDIDLDGEMGRTGFPLAKGGDSRLPIGPLLVIPNEDDFYRELTLKLYVNNTLRQKSGAKKMIWSPRQILSQAMADCRTPYQLESQTLFIGNCESIPVGTLLLTGTPEGVLFHLMTLWNPWVYLRSGDVVTSFGTFLGYTQNTIGKI
jgi:2-keto-4-pentenoate hydratase/2-oxohepta-3-ene-1,7-dioic acid hydratase in catechol pathway